MPDDAIGFEVSHRQATLLDLGVLEPGSPYRSAVAWRLPLGADPEPLVARLATAIANEEVLGANFARLNGVWSQSPPTAQARPLTRLILPSGAADDAVPHAWLWRVSAEILAEARRDDTLVGIGLWCGDREQRLVVVASPVVADRISLELMMARMLGANPAAPAFADVAPWLNGLGRAPADPAPLPAIAVPAPPVHFAPRCLALSPQVGQASLLAAWRRLAGCYDITGSPTIWRPFDQRADDAGLSLAIGPYGAARPWIAEAGAVGPVACAGDGGFWLDDRPWTVVGTTAEDQPSPIAALELADRVLLSLLASPDAPDERALVFDAARISPAVAQRLSGELLSLAARIDTHPDEDPDEFTFWDEPAACSAQAGLIAPAPNPAAGFEVLFTTVAAEAPDRIAIEDGERTLSYGALAVIADGIAETLRRAGAGPGVVIALDLPPGAPALVMILGILKAGAAFLPLAAEDPSGRTARIVADSRAALIVGVNPTAPAWTEPERWVRLDPDTLRLSEPAGPHRILPPGVDHDVAYVLFTSGSTGLPKGVAVPRFGLASYCVWAAKYYDLDQGSGAVVTSGLAVDLTVSAFLAPLLAGQRVIVASKADPLADLARRLTPDADLSLLKLTPSQLALLNELLGTPAPGAVRTLVIGGEPLPADLIAPWRTHAPASRVFNEYGPTETVVGCTVYDASAHEDGVAPIGAPCAGASIRLLDARGRHVPPGMRGEILIGGPGVSAYLGAPDLTAARFIDNTLPGHPHGRLYRSGDIARQRADGMLILEGRLDRQLKLHGRRLEPAEIEAVLRLAPGVRDAAVILVERDVLVGVVEADPAHGDVLEPVRGALQTHLPQALRPHRLLRVECLPRTGSGKIDRDALAALTGKKARTPFVPPRSPVERLACAIMAEVVCLPAVGLDEDFVEIGGDSMRAVQFITRLADKGVALGVVDLFELRSVKRLSDAGKLRLSNEGLTDVPEPFALLTTNQRRRVPAGAEDAFPASRMQLGMIYENALHGAGAYHDVFAYRIDAPVEPALLERAAGRLVRRHAALRSWFDLGGDPPLQIVGAAAADILTLEDLRHARPGIGGEAIDRWIADELGRGFDLTRAPLVRLHAILAGTARFTLGVSFHHAVIDGWSDVSMVREFLDDYVALLTTPERPLAPTPPRAGALFATLEARALGNPASLAHWRNKLRDAPKRVVGENRSVGQMVAVVISTAASDAILDTARLWSLPVKTVLLAAHLKALAALEGRDEVLTAVVTGTRPKLAGVDEALGLFINTLPMRQDARTPDLQALARAVLAEELADYPHRRFPLAAIVELGRPESLFYFTDYHNAHDLRDRPDVAVRLVRSHEVSSFELAANFAVHPFGGRVVLNLHLRAGRAPAPVVSAYSSVLESFASSTAGRFAPPAPGEKPSKPAHPRLVAERFAAVAEANPAAVAIGWRDRRTTYGDLAAVVAGLVLAFENAGLVPGDRIGVMLSRAPILPAAILAALTFGVCYVPIDPVTAPKRLPVLLEQSGAALVVCDDRSAARLSRLGTRILRADLCARRPPTERPRPSPESLAYIMFTSGSTGLPKGVEVGQLALAGFLAAIDALCPPDAPPVFLALSSIGFDISLMEMLWPLCHGGVVVLQEDPDSWFPPRRTPRAVVGPRFSVFSFPPTGPGAHRRLLRVARRADALGFEAIWTPERHLSPIAGDFANPAVTAAALAAVTERLGIRAGSLALPLHHPFRAAEDWAQVDRLSGGRSGVAFARGWDASTRFLAATDEAAFFDTIAAVRRLWRGGSWTTADGAAVSLAPSHQPLEIPAWVSVAGDPVQWVRAAREELRVLTHLLIQTPRALAENIDAYHRGGGIGVTLMLHAAVVTDAAEARAVNAALRAYLKMSAVDPCDAALDADAAEQRDRLIEGAAVRILGEHGLIGDVATCVDRALFWRERGVDEIACLIDFDTDEERVITALERLDTVRAACEASGIPPARSGALTLAENLERFGVTHIQLTPSTAGLVLQEPEACRTLHRLDVMFIGGEALSASLAESLGRASPARLLNMYGPTEATIWATAWDFTGFSRTNGAVEVRIGRPLHGVDTQVLDETGAPAEEGELYLSGPALARGYTGDPVLTAERFVTRDETRLYRTGDRVRRLVDGDLTWLGRLNRQVKVNGRRVELGEIEALARAAPGVIGAVASLEAGALTLTVTPTPEAALTPAGLSAHLAEHFPFGLVPSRITVSASPPLSLAGKLQAVDDARLATMLNLWRHALQQPSIGPDDNFFALGGASIAAVTLMARIADTFGEALPLRALFETPTPAGLVARLAAKPGPAASVATITPPTTDPWFALAPSQEQVWLSHALAPQDPSFNMAALLSLEGSLDAARLAQALQLLIERHDALRCVITVRNGRPHQRVVSPGALRLDRLDVIGLGEVTLTQTLAAKASEPFDLLAGPPVRFVLAVQGPGRHKLLVVAHHAVCDGWSLSLLVDELIVVYEALAAGRPVDLLPTPRLATFVQDQFARLSANRLAKLETFWRETLAGADLNLGLPLDFARLARTGTGGSHRFSVSPAVTDSVAKLAIAHGVTDFMVLAATFAATIGLYADVDDVVFGGDVAGRPIEFHRLVGSLANRLPLRFDLGGDPSLTAILARARTRLPDQYDHADLPLAEMARRLWPDQSGGHPLLRTAMTLQEGKPLRRTMANVALRQEPLDIGAARLDLEVNLQRNEGGLDGVAQFRSDLFGPATIASFCDAWMTLLAAALEAPHAPLTSLNACPDGPALIGPVRALDATPAIDQILARAKTMPGATALVADGATHSYGDLACEIEAVAAGLAAAGIDAAAPVAVLTNRTVTPLAMLAVMRLGAPFMLLGATAPVGRLAAMLARARAGAVVFDETHRTLAESLTRKTPVALVAFETLRCVDGPVLPPAVVGAEPAYICFTSGSSGEPKGAIVTQTGMANHLRSKIDLLNLGPDDVVAQTSPETFDIYVWQVLAPLLAGAAVRIYGDDLIRDPSALGCAVAQDEASVWEVVPSFLRALLDAEPFPLAGRRLRWLMVTGEALDPELCRRWLTRHPGIPIVNAYGPAECSDDVTHHVLRDSPSPSQLRVPIGEPIANTELHIRTPAGRPAPRGAVGELVIGGVCVGGGYVNDPERTCAAFGADVRSGLRVYCTGDRVRIGADGALDFLGRVDNQIKLRGHRIELDEITAAIRQHPAVQTAAVVLRGDEAAPQLAAYVVVDRATAARVLGSAAAEAARLLAWESVYDSATRLPTDGDLFDIQTVTWIDSYQNERIPRAEMLAWRNAVAARLLALPHERTLEIGAGAGLILHAMAGSSGLRRYIATDASAGALDVARRAIDAAPGPDRFSLRHQPAHNFAGLEAERFDLVIVNSALQYFPSREYLLEVLDAASAQVAPGGAIFLGDVRDLRLSRMFHLSVLTAQGRRDLPARDLAFQLEAACARENELLVSPAFFQALGERWSRLRRVDIRLKGTGDANEMTRFRYDVVLRFDTAGLAAEPAVLDLGPCPNAAALARAAAQIPVRIVGLRNRRLAAAAAALDMLQTAAPDERLGEIDEVSDSLDPAEVASWAGSLQLDCALVWSAAGLDRFDVLLFRPGQVPPPDPLLPHEAGVLTSDPLQAAIDREVEQDLRRHLAQRLPDVMLPASITRLAALPLTVHGKLDRSALPQPGHLRPDLARRFEPPEGPVEILLARIMAELLRIQRIGRKDNFFQLGCDSIIVIQFVARARIKGLRLEPADAFRHRTIETLAGACAREPDEHATPVSRGQAPATPAQAIWLALGHSDRDHFNQAVWLQPARALQPIILAEALRAVLAYHEGLRLAFTDDVARVVDPPPCDPVLLTSDEAELGKALKGLQISLRVATGRLLAAALVDLADGVPPGLVLVAHHLAVDQASWEILAEDLETAYCALEDGLPPRLPSATPFTHAATTLATLGEAPEVLATAEFWRRQTPTLGRQKTAAILQSAARTIDRRLSADDALWLRGSVAPSLDVGLETVLLAAVLRALVDWTGEVHHTLMLESQGRHGPLAARADIARTVGWFTAAWPLAFELGRRRDPVADILAVAGRRAGAPDGLTFGLLRRHGPAAGRDAIAAAARCDVAFNFFGDLDRSHQAGQLLSFRSRDLGPIRGAANIRPHPIHVDAWMERQGLVVAIEYDRGLHDDDSVAHFANRIIDALLEACAVLPREVVARPTAGLPALDLAAALLEMDGY